MDAQDLHRLFLESRGVQIDSRLLEPGQLFFALKGNSDGNRFARQALDRGALRAVVDDPALREEPGCTWVPDVLEALQHLALHHRRYLRVPILALTGSNGKTTTKELLARVLACRFQVYATPGNFNNHIGVPLTILGIPPGTGMAVVEMGASAQGEIARLCAIAEPDYGLITNIGLAHLEGFGGPEGVRKGKGELYEHLKARGKTIFYLADEPPLPEMVGAYQPAFHARLGPIPARDQARLLETDPVIRMAFQGGDGETYTLQSSLFGIHNARNILLALRVGQYFEVPAAAMAEAIASYIPRNNRSQWETLGSTRLLLDAYNANPGSMVAAIRSFAQVQAARKILILGDMLELGEAAAAEHQAIVEVLEGLPDPEVVLVGPLFAATRHPAHWQILPDAPAVSHWLLQQHRENTAILLKGSRGMALEQVWIALQQQASST